MAWNEINYSCGHKGRVQLYGHHTARDSKKSWMERGVCPDCYRAQKEAERKMENELSAEKAKKAGLPELIGSEKQIAWAETIRKNALMSPKNTICPSEIFESKNPDNEQRAIYSAVSAARSRLENERSAKWWIENRNSVNSYCYDCGQNIKCPIYTQK